MAEQEEKARGKRRAEPEKKKVDPSGTVRSIRNGVATAVWVLAVLAAVILAAGALVITLDFNENNAVVEFFRETADNINLLGELKSFEASGKGADAQHDALVKTVLVNWGICAVVYLVAGKLLERVIRP